MKTLTPHWSALAAPLRPVLTLPLTLALTLLLTLTLGACNSVSMTGTGPEVEARVQSALLADGADCTSRGPDGVVVQPYGPISVSDPAHHAGVGASHLDPSRGKFLFEAMSTHYFGNLRWIEVSITPWDERPDITRQVSVNVWHFNYVPPLTPGPDFLLTDIVMDRLRESGESGAASAGSHASEGSQTIAAQ